MIILYQAALKKEMGRTRYFLLEKTAFCMVGQKKDDVIDFMTTPLIPKPSAFLSHGLPTTGTTLLRKYNLFFSFWNHCKNVFPRNPLL
jgi:hypothetical protein